MGQPQEGRTETRSKGAQQAERRAAPPSALATRECVEPGGAPGRGQPVQFDAMAPVADLAEVAGGIRLEDYDYHDHNGMAASWER